MFFFEAEIGNPETSSFWEGDLIMNSIPFHQGVDESGYPGPRRENPKP